MFLASTANSFPDRYGTFFRALARDVAVTTERERALPQTLIDELRAEQQTAERRILMTNPASAVAVRGDRARIRQSLASLISERAAGAELSFMVDKRGEDAELVITSGDYRPVGDAEGAKDELGMSVELAQLLFAAQGGSVRIARNPLTRSLRVTARLPLA